MKGTARGKIGGWGLSLALVLALVLALALALAGCASESKSGGAPGVELEEAPAVVITADGQELAYVVGYNIWNDAVYDRETTDAIWEQEYGYEYMLQVAPDAEIRIEFAHDPPSGATVYQEAYDAPGRESFGLEVEDNALTFVFEDISGYDPGADMEEYERVYSGRNFFTVVCGWDELGNVCEYGFCVTVAGPE